jgi:hypothetical protein
MADAVMKISFAGNMKVNAELFGKIIPTDQSKKAGGDETAPEPFMLFLASIGACAGVYVLGFCRSRNIPTDSLAKRFGFTLIKPLHRAVAATALETAWITTNNSLVLCLRNLSLRHFERLNRHLVWWFFII